MRKSNVGRTPKVFSTSYRPSAPAPARIPQSWKAPLWQLLSIVAAIFLLSRLPIFRVKTVTVEGSVNPKLQTELQKLQGSSIFSSRVVQVTQKLLKEDSELASLTCRKGLPSSITCQAAVREPALMWLQSGKEYLVDATGLVYKEKPADQAVTAWRVEDRSPVPVKVGAEVTSALLVEQAVNLKKLLDEAAITADRFFVSDSLYQLGAVTKEFAFGESERISRELTVYFITTQPLEAQVATLRTLLKERGKSVAERIDLRVPGYVYYR